MTAKEIIDKVMASHHGETFRAVLKVKTFEGKKQVSGHSMWVVGQIEPEEIALFVDFTEPEESKGLRFLARMKPDEKPQAYMFLPATGRTVAIDVDDPSTDIGGTGLTIADLQPLIPKKGEKQALLKEEKVDGKDCYVISVSSPDGKGKRVVWVTKDQLDVIKMNQQGPDGKVVRALKIEEFFKTKKGRYYPRREVITLPQQEVTIKVRQEHGVYGIIVPEELLDPKTFGKYKWRM